MRKLWILIVMILGLFVLSLNKYHIVNATSDIEINGTGYIFEANTDEDEEIVSDKPNTGVETNETYYIWLLSISVIFMLLVYLLYGRNRKIL